MLRTKIERCPKTEEPTNYYTLVIVGLNIQNDLQNMLFYFILCKMSKHELHNSKHEPCRSQSNKLAKFDGGNIMSSHMTLEVPRSKYGWKMIKMILRNHQFLNFFWKKNHPKTKAPLVTPLNNNLKVTNAYSII
jgi:hypothetical protein